MHWTSSMDGCKSCCHCIAPATCLHQRACCIEPDTLGSHFLMQLIHELSIQNEKLEVRITHLELGIKLLWSCCIFLSLCLFCFSHSLLWACVFVWFMVSELLSSFFPRLFTDFDYNNKHIQNIWVCTFTSLCWRRCWAETSLTVVLSNTLVKYDTKNMTQ